MLAIYLLAASILELGACFIAYDCGGAHLNTTTISLLDTEECDLKHETPIVTPTQIQLLQLSNINHVEIIQCKVNVNRIIYHCGMHSHTSIVHNGAATYLQEITREVCIEMHREGRLVIGTGKAITTLRPNGTFYYSALLAGKVGTDGACKGEMYADNYGTWDDVVVQAQVTISLRNGYAPVHLETGKITLKSGTICLLSDEKCMDSDDGNTFWKSIPNTICGYNKYDVLYEGVATKLEGGTDSEKTIIYTLTTQDITFALTSTRHHIICGYTIISTEHPKLFIYESRIGQAFKKKEETPIDNLDIFAYVNSKFIYVERHIRTQMKALYHDIIQQKCELERRVLQNTLSLATLLPDEFAFRLMKSPGYMAVATGEVVHVLRCIPVEVTIRKTNSCHTDLPVTLRNTSYFITPKSHILTRYSTQQECNSLLPIQYYIENTWIQFSPIPSIVIPPQTLKPLTKLTWTYSKPQSLATSGIYSGEDLEKLRNHIMFPAEKGAVLHTIARGFVGQPVSDKTISLKKLLDSASLDKIYANTASKLWSGFMTFGSATAGVFGVFVIIRIIKIVFDTLVHGYALHSAYGCSLHLLGALWSSIANLLLHLANRNTSSNTQVSPETPQQDETAHTETRHSTTGNIPHTYTFRELQSRIDGIGQIPRKE